jgi:hypothetical protein
MNIPNILIRKFQDVGLEVNLGMTGYYDAEIQKADGRVYKPWDKPQKNAINPKFKDIFLSQQTISSHAGGGAGSSYFQDILFRNEVNMVIGSDGGAINAYDQSAVWTVARDFAVNTFVASATTRAGIGNSATIDPTTGNLVMTVRIVFAPAEQADTIREVAIGGSKPWRDWSPTYGQARFSRAVLSSPIVRDIGDVLTMSYTMVIPSLAVTPQTVTLAAQNGLNLSGQLKLIGNMDHMIGGVISASGTNSGAPMTTNQSTSYGGAIWPSWPSWALSTDSAFPAYLSGTTASATNAGVATSTALLAYTNGSYNRTISGQWAPGARTFRSLYLKQGTMAVGGAYQLLLDSSQNQAADKTLVVGLNFAL